MKKIIAISLALGVLLFSACATAAGLADFGAQVAGAAGIIDPNTAAAISQSAAAIGRAAEEINPEQEYYIGRAVAANILTSYRIRNVSSAQLAYLNNICMSIVINSPRPDIFNGYFVNVLDTPEVNAFATPGGHIFLTWGLISSADSEDALAAIIAHEVAHIQLQHGINSIRNNRITQALIVTGLSAGGAAAGMNVTELTDVFNESVGEIVQTLVNNGFSQAQEFEADTLAMSLMASAGYDPRALVSMLQVLDRNNLDRTRGFGRTHPSPAQRITNAQRTVDQHRVQDTRSFRAARFQTAMR